MTVRNCRMGAARMGMIGGVVVVGGAADAAVRVAAVSGGSSRAGGEGGRWRWWPCRGAVGGC